MITIDQGESTQAAVISHTPIVGWKIGFGSVPAKERLGIDQPLVGYLTEQGATSAPVDLRATDQPKYETEVAVWLGADIPAGASVDQVRDAISGVGLAFEFVDLTLTNFSPEVVGEILSGNIFHHSYTLGAPIAGVGVDDIAHLKATVRCTHADGSEDLFDVTDSISMIGSSLPTLTHAATQAQRLGRGLQRGDVVLMGSLVPPQPVLSGDAITYEWVGFPDARIETTFL